MDTDRDPIGSRSSGFLSPPSSSFVQYLAMAAPELLPGRRTLPPGVDTSEIPHGTTIIAAVYDGGVVMAGDRRATAGNMIAVRHVDKVHAADEYSAIGYAGSAGFGAEIVRLYQVELEHYEKIEGTPLSAEGKANRLSMLIRNHLGLAMQGLAVVPLLAAYDPDAGKGRIYSYDPTGGRTEERGFHGIGSGSIFARGAMKKLYQPDAGRDDCVAACLQALYDAADDDSATGGPDVTRQIYPLVADVNESGFTMIPEAEIARLVDRMLTGRMEKPDGPTAPVFEDPAGSAGEGSDAR